MIESSDKTEIEGLEKKFKEDIKSRIDETAKYIRPRENTTDYAYMFILLIWLIPRFIEQSSRNPSDKL